MNEQANILRGVHLFRDLSDVELDRVWSIAIPRYYHKRSNIFMEGAKKEAVFVVQSGLVKAYKTDSNGKEHILSFMKAGEMFPHTGFFYAQPYPGTAEAVMDTHILAFPIRSFEQLMIDMPTIAIKVMRVMSERIMDLQEKLQKLTGQDVFDRGLAFLLKLAQKYGIEEDRIVHINVPLTHQEIANAIGTTRESVSRFINQMRKERIIETHRNGMMILNMDALKN